MISEILTLFDTKIFPDKILFFFLSFDGLFDNVSECQMARSEEARMNIESDQEKKRKRKRKRNFQWETRKCQVKQTSKQDREKDLDTFLNARSDL